MRTLQGTIVSDKMQKTVVVRVDSLKEHPKYLKRFLVSQKFHVHAADGEYQIGDIVVIQETRPLSKQKRWKVTKLVRRPEVAELVKEVQEKAASQE